MPPFVPTPFASAAPPPRRTLAQALEQVGHGAWAAWMAERCQLDVG